MPVPQDLGLSRFNALPQAEAEQALLACCSSPAWAAELAQFRPYESAQGLYAAAEQALGRLGEGDIADALAGHPRIGDRMDGESPGGSQAGSAPAWSQREQSGVVTAPAGVRAALAEGNREYERRFGHVYLVCASGKGAEELLDVLRSRLDNDGATERRVLREELAKINRIRLGRLVGDADADADADADDATRTGSDAQARP